VAYLLPYAGTDEGPCLILAPNIEDPVAGDAAEGATVAGDAAQAAVVAGDAAQAAAVAGDAAEGDAFPADLDEDVDEVADHVVVNLQTTWFLASNTYHYGNFDLLWIQIDGDRHINAPAQFEDGIRLSTYYNEWEVPMWIFPDWSRIHINGGAPAIGSQLIYQPTYYNEWEAPMWIFPTMPRAPQLIVGNSQKTLP
jgi:hypothetical protein